MPVGSARELNPASHISQTRSDCPGISAIRLVGGATRLLVEQRCTEGFTFDNGLPSFVRFEVALFWISAPTGQPYVSPGQATNGSAALGRDHDRN